MKKISNNYTNSIFENIKNINIDEYGNEYWFVRTLQKVLKYKEDKVMQQLVAQVPWGHNIVLIDKEKNKEIRKCNVK